jgi:hypothetical protein
MIGIAWAAAATATDVRAAATEGLPTEAPQIVVYDAAVEVTAAARLASVRAARQAAPADLRWQAEELRVLYFLAIEEEDWLAEAEAAARALGARPAVGAAVGVTAAAYLGALETLRAKHAFWPMRKLRHLDDGLAELAAAIAADPRHVEARYLRLMSCYWLPGFLGRGDLVVEDFAALAPLLAEGPGDLPVDLWANTVRFVLDKAPALDDRRRSDLAAALNRWSTERAS